MTQGEEAEKRLEVPEPNIDDPDKFNGWLDTYVLNPIKGLEYKTHDDGSHFSREEQIAATKEQLRNTREEFMEMMPPDQVRQILKTSVEGLINR